MYGTKLVTWQKPNGELIDRKVCYDDYSIGQTNCYNWKVVDVKYYLGNGKFGTEHELNKKHKHRDNLERLEFGIKDSLINMYKNLITIIEAMLLIKVIELILHF